MKFHKMHGCGNDFVFIDNRELGLPVANMSAWAQVLCDRKRGVGADGLMFLDATPPDRQGDYIWHFYSRDGLRGEMCGNGARCAAWLAVELGLAAPCHVLGTDAGLVRAEVDRPGRRVRLELTRPGEVQPPVTLTIGGRDWQAFLLDTGVPHLVLFLPDVTSLDVPEWGPRLRRPEVLLPRTGPAGANVNFVTVDSPTAIRVRTFERGVEEETLACGTGAAASVCIARSLGLTDSRVDVTTSGGEILGIELLDGAVFLSGAVQRVFSGTLDPEGFEPPLPFLL